MDINKIINLQNTNIMKKLLMVAMTLILASLTTFADNKNEKGTFQNRLEINKMAKKELTAKVSKIVKKESKRLKKEGWLIKPGELPLEKQLERAYLMQYEYDENLYPKYVMGEASSIGENFDAAKIAETNLAIANLANQIQVEVTALIKNTVSNRQLASDDAASITESVMASTLQIVQRIERVMPVMECYRINEKKNIEVLVRLAYNGEMAKAATKEAVREELRKKGEDLQTQLDKVLGF